jgi:hypothetical protein
MGVEMSHFVLVKNLISDDIQKGKKPENERKKHKLLSAECGLVVVFHRQADYTADE